MLYKAVGLSAIILTAGYIGSIAIGSLSDADAGYRKKYTHPGYQYCQPFRRKAAFAERQYPQTRKSLRKADYYWDVYRACLEDRAPEYLYTAK